MNKILVTVFDTQENAFNGLTALKDLHSNGDISLHAAAVITKDGEGNVSIKDSDDEGPIGSAIGALSGALIGMLGGPAGVVVGGSAGMLGGLYYDVSKSGIDVGFLEDVAGVMKNNKVAVIADMEEGWTAPVDTKMSELNGEVFRRNRYEVEDEQLIKAADEINDEIDELKEELKDANDQTKASINKQIEKLKDKRKSLIGKIEEKKDHMSSEIEAKKKKLNAQISEAKDSAKAKLEKRKANLEANYEKRKAKLNAGLHKVTEYIT